MVYPVVMSETTPDIPQDVVLPNPSGQPDDIAPITEVSYDLPR